MHAGFKEPTAIQAQGWPMALKGRDLVGLAETGSREDARLLASIRGPRQRTALPGYALRRLVLTLGPCQASKHRMG